MTGLLLSRIAVVILVMIATAAVAVLAWLAVRRLWQAIRPHPGGHAASRHDDYEPVFLGAPTADTIPVKDVDGDPPWPPAPELGKQLRDGLDYEGVWYPVAHTSAHFFPTASTDVQRDRWNAGDETRGLVVEPGWDEPDPDEPGWAETSVVGLYDLLGGYAYPEGFPPCHHDPAPSAALWPGDPGPVSAAELAAFWFELGQVVDFAGPDAADRVFEIMGGDT